MFFNPATVKSYVPNSPCFIASVGQNDNYGEKAGTANLTIPLKIVKVDDKYAIINGFFKSEQIQNEIDIPKINGTIGLSGVIYESFNFPKCGEKHCNEHCEMVGRKMTFGEFKFTPSQLTKKTQNEGLTYVNGKCDIGLGMLYNFNNESEIDMTLFVRRVDNEHHLHGLQLYVPKDLYNAYVTEKDYMIENKGSVKL